MRERPLWAIYRRALPCGLQVKGKRFHRYPVRATWSGISWKHEVRDVVIAESPAAAANWFLEFWASKVLQPVEVEAVGPKGGVTFRYLGWEGSIGRELIRHQPALWKQLEFPWDPADLKRPERRRPLQRANSGSRWFWRQARGEGG